MRYLVLIIYIITFNFLASSQVSEGKREWVTMSGLGFEIQGDFSGSDSLETLFVQLISKKSGEEIHRIEYTDSNSLHADFCKLVPQLILKSKTEKLKDFVLTDSCHFYCPFYMENIGDINNDGNDEIIVFFNGLPGFHPYTFQVYTYQNGWVEVNRFPLYGDYVYDGLTNMIDNSDPNNPKYIHQDGRLESLMKSE